MKNLRNRTLPTAYSTPQTLYLHARTCLPSNLTSADPSLGISLDSPPHPFLCARKTDAICYTAAFKNLRFTRARLRKSHAKSFRKYDC